MTLGGHHLAGEVFRRCGGRNVFDGLSSLAAVVGREDVIRADPEVILVATSSDPAAALAEWRRFPRMRAVQRDQLYQAPAAVMVRPTPRIVEGIEWLCATLDRVRKGRSGFQ
jgi:ABC-type Fe3+-hydroxamate transport system substrate-binding protein